MFFLPFCELTGWSACDDNDGSPSTLRMIHLSVAQTRLRRGGRFIEDQVCDEDAQEAAEEVREDNTTAFIDECGIW